MENSRFVKTDTQRLETKILKKCKIILSRYRSKRKLNKLKSWTSSMLGIHKRLFIIFQTFLTNSLPFTRKRWRFINNQIRKCVVTAKAFSYSFQHTTQEYSILATTTSLKRAFLKHHAVEFVHLYSESSWRIMTHCFYLWLY